MRCVVFISIAALLLASQLVAQQAPPATQPRPSDPAVQPTTPGAPTITDPARRPSTFGDPADRTTESQRPNKVFRASKIIGTNVKNKSNEDLGSINDIVIDARDGRVAYAAVSMGGFLGVGDKLFAVPWEAIECREENGTHVAYLDIDKQRMQDAQGFDQDKWPDMANQEWRTENDRRYRLQRSERHEVLKPVQPGTQPPATQPGTQPRTAPPTTTPTTPQQQPQR